MNVDHKIYELTKEQQERLFAPVPLDADDETRAEYERLREDTARLDGYLKGRADSDRPLLGKGAGAARGPGSNADLAG